MIVYHVDRDKCLKERQKISLQSFEPLKNCLEQQMSPDGLSRHGIHYINEHLQCIENNCPEYYVMEYELELIRRCFFPECPSRFQSLFAIKDLVQLEKWDGIFSSQDIVWEIEIEDGAFIELDSNLLIPALKKKTSDDTGWYFSPDDSFSYGYLYWQKQKTKNPREELLVPLNKHSVFAKRILGTIEEIKIKEYWGSDANVGNLAST